MSLRYLKPEEIRGIPEDVDVTALPQTRRDKRYTRGR
jgi:hypothetical protein